MYARMVDNFEEDLYSEWLVGLVNIFNDRDYSDLLYILFDIKFYSLIRYDEDRGADGIALRDEWAQVERLGGRFNTHFGEPRVLEVLIGIARRIEFQLFGSQYMDEWDYQKIFWDLIYNLGLEDYFDTLSKTKTSHVTKKVSQWLNREYFCHKKCHIFDIQEGHYDLQNLNIWTQMGLYIRERWPK